MTDRGKTPNFRDKNKAEAWLRQQSREVSVVIAARMVMRALPMLNEFFRARSKFDDPGSATVLPVLRAVAVAWAAGRYPARGKELSAAAVRAYHIARFIDSFAFTYAYTTGDDNARAAAKAAQAAAKTAHITASAIRAAAAQAAAYVTDTAFTNAFTDALSDAPFADAAAAADTVADTACAYAAAADAEQIADGLSTEELAGQPLWLVDMPAEFKTQWKGLKSELLALDQGWEVWSDWYEARLSGAPALEALEVARAKIPEEIWEQGSKSVNAEIRRLIDEHRPAPQTSGAEWGFFISYATQDESKARKIGDILQSEGYSVFAQYQDFEPGSNFVTEMQRGLANAGRVVALYSPAYAASGHCQAEWAAAYNADPAGAQRKLLPFLLEPTELPPLARQIIFKNLTGLTGDKLREAVLEAVNYKPPVRNEAETRNSLSDIASPQPRISKVDGQEKLDAAPHPELDVPIVDQNLADLPETQRAIADALQESLPGNCPPVVKNSLVGYRDHLTRRGTQPIVGLIRMFGDAIEKEYKSPYNEGIWSDGLEHLFESFLKNHQLLLTHFPLDEKRERVFSETPIIKIDKAVGDVISEPAAEFAKAVKEAGIGTDDYIKIMEALARHGKDIASLPSTEEDEELPKTVVTPTRRYLLTLIGFLERTRQLLSSMVKFASTPKVERLTKILSKTVDTLMKLFY